MTAPGTEAASAMPTPAPSSSDLLAPALPTTAPSSSDLLPQRSKERKRREAASAKEAAAVHELRELLLPVTADELTCIRFLRANDGHVKKAAKQYTAFLAWREREGIDGILDEPSQQPEIEHELSRCSMRLLDGLDLKGRPVMAAALGNIDMHELKKTGISLEVLARRHARAMEQLVQRVAAAADPHAGHNH